MQCDDTEMHYLKVLCDEIYGRDNYVNTISVNMTYQTNPGSYTMIIMEQPKKKDL